MNSNKFKHFISKYFPIILIVAVLLLVILIYFLVPEDIAFYIYLSIMTISLVLKFIVEILSLRNRIKLSITSKSDTVESLYELFDLENSNILIAINTKDETILSNIKKIFPGAKVQKQKELYSILLPRVTIKEFKMFLKDNDPERIIIHQFNRKEENDNVKNTHSLSICIDKKLIIQCNNKHFTKTERKNIKEKLIEK